MQETQGGARTVAVSRDPPRVSWGGAVAISLHILVPAQMGIGSDGKSRVRVAGGPRPPGAKRRRRWAWQGGGPGLNTWRSPDRPRRSPFYSRVGTQVSPGLRRKSSTLPSQGECSHKTKTPGRCVVAYEGEGSGKRSRRRDRKARARQEGRAQADALGGQSCHQELV